ncbi:MULTISPECIES: QueT transporter family protein [Lysinibacillus]|uniref:QueT transporter family protein n=2 Tax=Lysinibacillus xylanilyticus TaxID=582475 RepID=A0ABT4EQB6_9BACI|nr:QueT transporter family protein [Lysinibacillus xylanilyticus]MCY9547875.1 QueT transporter family protein [Lysinibacillus xylanilyticus]MED3802620.1 QueT transporter family protein [Lysinibacillus xylanilyticus]QPQ31638.1 QueT transporter family protein [Lysinibacillus sp. JNUCC-51]
MNTSIEKDSSRTSVTELTKTALVAALYVAVTVLLSVISFGAVQLRLSEMFNYLALYNKRYVLAVTLGVVLANFMSPTWVLDVPIGGIATFLVLILCRKVTKNITNDLVKMVVTALIFALSMFTVAGQLTILYDLPFWATWFTVGVGELLSMTVGGVTIYLLNKKIDLTK